MKSPAGWIEPNVKGSYRRMIEWYTLENGCSKSKFNKAYQV